MLCSQHWVVQHCCSKALRIITNTWSSKRRVRPSDVTKLNQKAQKLFLVHWSTSTSSLEKSFCYKRKNLKAGRMFPGGWAGHKQNLVCFLWDHPASIQSQPLPWHSTENMFANVSFVVCVWITRMETMKLLVVANYRFQGLFYSFKVIKKFHQPFSTI